MTSAASSGGLHAMLVRAAAELHLDLSTAQAQQLLDYMVLLKRWNATYNLTAIREEAAMLTQHIVDCLAVIGPLQRETANQAGAKLLDVGSGAGLPGCVVAIMAPAMPVVCVDSVGKKAAFIRQAAAELGLRNLRAVHARVESLKGETFEVITSRAFASLTDFVVATDAAAAPATLWMAMKGKRPDDEIASLPASATVFHVEQLNVPGLDADRCLIWLKRRAVPAI